MAVKIVDGRALLKTLLLFNTREELVSFIIHQITLFAKVAPDGDWWWNAYVFGWCDPENGWSNMTQELQIQAKAHYDDGKKCEETAE